MSTRPTQQSESAPVYSLAVRKALLVVFAAPLLVGFTLLLLQYKGLIDVEDFGLRETYLYIVCAVAAFGGLAGIFAVWRCPGCSTYLGREWSLSRCPRCSARLE